MRVVVALAGRGSLPLTRLNGLTLVEHALAALTEYDDVLVVADSHPGSVSAAQLPGLCAGNAVLLHDPLCPLTPVEFIDQVVAQFHQTSAYAMLGHRPVTDTLKRVDDGVVAGTVDRERLLVAASPLVLSARAVADLGEELSRLDFAHLVSVLRQTGEESVTPYSGGDNPLFDPRKAPIRRRGVVELVEAPSIGRRVEDESAVRLLEGLVATR